MKVGLISDTHGFLDDQVFSYFSDRDEIWHAGDFGTTELASQLAEFKLLKGVWGNIDDQQLRNKFPEYELMKLENQLILMIHIAGTPARYSRQVKKLIAQHQPNILICGHSHILKVIRDPDCQLLYINPGAAGRQGFHRMRTIMRFEIQNTGIKNLEAIELGLRGKI